MPLRVSDKEIIRQSGEKIEYTQEMLSEFTKCADDVVYFATHYYYIINVDKGEQLFEMYACQKKALRAMQNPPDNKKNVIVASSRQIGKSLMVSCLALHHTLFNEHKNVLIVANKEKTALGILRKIKFAFSKLPKWLQQGITDGGWMKKAVTFENGSRIEVSTTTATSGRSESINCVYGDTKIKIRNKITGEIREIPISDLIKNEYK